MRPVLDILFVKESEMMEHSASYKKDFISRWLAVLQISLTRVF